MEHKLFKGIPDYVSQEWYKDRGPAPHVDQGNHAMRIFVACAYIQYAQKFYGVNTLMDLGAGDGGLLATIKHLPITAFGYDLAPKNVEAAKARGVTVMFRDFVSDIDDLPMVDLIVMTEILEHLQDPYGILKKLPSDRIVASSPHWETENAHYPFHLWVWDVQGFEEMFDKCGWKIKDRLLVHGSQIVYGERK